MSRQIAYRLQRLVCGCRRQKLIRLRLADFSYLIHLRRVARRRMDFCPLRIALTHEVTVACVDGSNGGYAAVAETAELATPSAPH